MDLNALIATAQETVEGITPAQLAVVAAAWMRINKDGDDEDVVVKWARRLVGTEPTSGELQQLRERGMSIREIASAHGIPKSTVARKLSQAA